jgi:hypothetical protein
LFWELFGVNLPWLFGVKLGHAGAGGVVGRGSGVAFKSNWRNVSGLSGVHGVSLCPSQDVPRRFNHFIGDELEVVNLGRPGAASTLRLALARQALRQIALKATPSSCPPATGNSFRSSKPAFAVPRSGPPLPSTGNLSSYIGRNPLAYADPSGKDAAAVNFGGMVAGFGHEGKLSIHQDGSVTYARFGPVATDNENAFGRLALTICRT